MDPDDPDVPRVKEGVYFSSPESLPRGRHNLSREHVAAAQRERLLIATTELLAARGYRGFGPGDVASRAGVSLAAFYGCFENKDACIFAGYDRSIEVLIGRMTSIDLEGMAPPEAIHALLGTYLEMQGSDPVVARAYQVEIDALGAPARERRRNALTLFAEYMREAARRASPGIDLPWSAYIGVAYATRQLTSDALDAEAEPDLAALGEDIQAWLEDLYRRR